MTEIKASDVKALREMSGAGMMDCKKALAEAGGDQEKALEILRKMGLKAVDKRSGKTAAEGVIGMYQHSGGQIAGIIELNCETDFVARGDDFQEAAHGLAMHAVAMKPAYLAETDIPEEILAKEKEIIFESLNENQKDKADKIIPGKLRKFAEENCFLKQAFIKDDKKSVQDVLDDLSAKVGEKVSLRRFQVFTVGEGIEKEEADLLADVQETLASA